MIISYLEKLKTTISNIDIESINNIAKCFITARDNNSQIIVFGNGGSGSTASHMVCDILKGCSYGKEKKYRILSLNDNIPTILAYSNDVSYDDVFIEQLKNYLQPNDIVLGISGSGNSKNIIKAIEYAKIKGNVTIGFTGFNGGSLKKIVDHSFNSSIDDMQISEDIHMIGVHILYKLLSNS
jgi:D-sedoheptulose 7-phosphate isomerase